MPEPHAVLYVTNELSHLVKSGYLPIWHLTGDESLNDLWLENGKYATDVYAYGDVSKWTIRQLRGHGFIFISTHKNVQLADIIKTVDVRVSREVVRSQDMKMFENEVGRRRIRMRKGFGDALRNYAFKVAIELHGSEAETLNDANPRLHKVYGMPEIPPLYMEYAEVGDKFDDEPTDEKLVSMLDYIIYSAEEVHYVGCGDLRTLMLFKKRSPGRFKRVLWHVYDPIAPQCSDTNVIVHNVIVDSKKDVLKHMNFLKRVERLFVWDVSSDRNQMDDDEWESTRFAEDRLGEEIAYEMGGAFSSALIKHRIPAKKDEYHCISTYLLPQPGADTDMYELRNFMKLKGYSHIDRHMHPDAAVMKVVSRDVRRMVETFHGKDRGRFLKKRIFEHLHIMRKNGLFHESDEPRADLFYLTNRRNMGLEPSIYEVMKKSTIATVWVGRTPLYDYDDYSLPRSTVMLNGSYRDIRVLDGNGAILFLMWKYPDIIKKDLTYDPAWAMNFAVSLKEPIPDPPVPDISLCRFIGLRVESSVLRVRNPTLHETADELKRMGLDLSGHLYVTLMSGAYVTDLFWWFKMILEWSSQGKEQKIRDLKRSAAEVIEWKEQMAERPWHVRNDLIAALREYKRKMGTREGASIDSWLELLRHL
ncbi:VP4 [Bluetongue virus 20]|uniref:Core protein VP4 n=2 Tax=Bluetongue virus TaxID=40051 RepID=I3W7M8_BTV|nr:VP4 [Bluetongue virus 20]QHJ68587.1 Cap [Bluetongue virus]QPK39796.1 VP4 [Bluetongue virus 20]